MHGSYAANMALTNSDLIIALGVRFDDRVTGRLAAFAPHAKVIHVDIDPAEIGKNRAADMPIVGDVKRVLAKLNKPFASWPRRCRRRPPPPAGLGGRRFGDGRTSIRSTRILHDEIKPQHLMSEIDRLSGGEAIVASDVGQHQMWARAVHPVQRSAAVAQLRRPGLDGLRPAGRHRRAVRAARQTGLCARGRRRIPDVDSGTRHHRQSRPARSRSSS